MALEAVGVYIPYSTLVSLLDIKPWGTPHRNVRKLEEISQNIRIIYRQGELNDLIVAMDNGLAPLVFVWTGELSYWPIATWHALLIVGYDEQSFYVNDPAFENAPIQVSQGDLDLAWLAYDSFYAVVAPV